MQVNKIKVEKVTEATFGKYQGWKLYATSTIKWGLIDSTYKWLKMNFWPAPLFNHFWVEEWLENLDWMLFRDQNH